MYIVHGLEDTLLSRYQFSVYWYGSNAIQSKITDFFPRIDEYVLKYTHKCKEPIIVKIL